MNTPTRLLPALFLGLISLEIRAADLVIDSPKDYQVVQRVDAKSGTVRLFGRGIEGDIAWQYRFEGKSAEGAALGEEWRPFPGTLKKGQFDFITTVPAGGWYRLEVRGLKDGVPSAAASVEHVGVGEVFVVAGQSNAGNYGSEPQRPQSGLVTSFDGKTWAPANDPQKGAGGKGGSFLPAFGDKMANHCKVPVGLIPLAVGSTSIREWLPKGEKFAQQTTTGKGVQASEDGQWESTGALFQTLNDRLRELGSNGLRAILWHQGESDAGQVRGGAPADRQISGEQYSAFTDLLVNASRKEAGWGVPWFTAQTTYHSPQDASDAEFRSAQSRAWQRGLTFEGPDTDTLQNEYRHGVHFNAKGLQKHGELWAEKIAPWLETQLTRQYVDGPPTPDYKLVWSDEFDGVTLDPKKWSHEKSGPRKEAFNDPSAATLDGAGHLVIRCSRQDERVIVDMINTRGLFEPTFGYFEARVQFQTQEGWWPGFWLQSKTITAPEKGTGELDDTIRNGTEIDIFEYLRIRGDQIQHALHWNGYAKLHKSLGQRVTAPNLTSGFHTVGCEWTPDAYTFYVDGRKTFHTTQAISRIPEFIILSGEVLSWTGDISKATLPDSVVFDYVRVWQKPQSK